MSPEKLAEEWDKLSDKKNLSGRAAMAAVEKEGLLLRYVKDQTEEICLAAVTQDGRSLQFVIIQTDQICLAAVAEDMSALRYVNEDIINKWRAARKLKEDGVER